MDSITNFINEEQCGLDEIHKTFEYFLEEKMYIDVSFSVKCGDGWMDYSAHKLIISMWSPVFADMCYKSHNDNDGPIRLEDVSPSTFEAMLKFMYGSLPERHLRDIPFLLKLYKGAVAYEVEALKNLCSEIFLCATPNKYNIFQLLDAGKLLDCESLVQRCYKILQTKTADVLAAQELCNITPAMLMTILDMPYVSFTSEYELISWVFAWVKNELLKDSQKRAFKEILGDFLPYLNFLNLSSEEFAKLYRDRKSDLMSEQEGFSIFMNIALPGSYPLPSWYPSSPKQRKYKNQVYMVSSELRSMDSFERNFQSLK